VDRLKGFKGDRSVDPSDLASYGGPCPVSYLFMHAGLLFGVAHAQGPDGKTDFKFYFYIVCETEEVDFEK